MAALAGGCSAERQAWRAAEKTASAESYRTYLAQWPQGRDQTSALSRIDELDAQTARARGDVAAWEGYLRVHPAGVARAEAQGELRDLALAAARAAGTVEAIEVFLGRWPQDPERGALEAQVDELHWKAADAEGTRRSWGRYLSYHPQGAHAAEARGRFDDDLWLQVKKADDLAGYLRFIEDQPDNARVPEARARIEALRFSGVEILIRWRGTFRKSGRDLTFRDLTDLVAQTAGAQLEAAGFRVGRPQISDVTKIPTLGPLLPGQGRMIVEVEERAGEPVPGGALTTRVVGTAILWSPGQEKPVWEAALDVTTPVATRATSEEELHGQALVALAGAIQRQLVDLRPWRSAPPR